MNKDRFYDAIFHYTIRKHKPAANTKLYNEAWGAYYNHFDQHGGKDDVSKFQGPFVQSQFSDSDVGQKVSEGRAGFHSAGSEITEFEIADFDAEL
ncbi:predicted protein [Lichtheimia corymbifera JMRC:FSU:9682]|uniref:Uncharacterized protein n=1 Tax=Lichtheimia corymbifera JMRC:FSU:9682 TaxID=1263082 RepID=A0A068S6S9_9FUNG|nr:predicted protein [Lichtheimia corymbifera JMRC:FSU:9682]